MRCTLARKQFDIADDLDACAACQIDRQVRLGMRQRYAGRQYKRCKGRPVRGTQVRNRDAFGLRLGNALRVVVPCGHFRSTRDQRTRCCKARATQPEQCALTAFERRGGRHAITAA